ncbi:hypothetical protein [Mycolicibacterium houstonense]|uniref:hypothetical protein n=1 Tax=Mycolicibacterium houstonense TaxID=146021 RepID=UPI000ADD9BA0|nr:hypothetical protein [Mycolicibacterium houstonense]
MSATVEQFRPPSHLLNKGQYARVNREAPRHRYEDKADWLAAQWDAARRLYPSMVGPVR